MGYLLKRWHTAQEAEPRGSSPSGRESALKEASQRTHPTPRAYHIYKLLSIFSMAYAYLSHYFALWPKGEMAAGLLPALLPKRTQNRRLFRPSSAVAKSAVLRKSLCPCRFLARLRCLERVIDTPPLVAILLPAAESLLLLAGARRLMQLERVCCWCRRRSPHDVRTHHQSSFEKNSLFFTMSFRR
jgi:hypothetical protein